MYYSVSVDHKGMAGHVTRSECEWFEEVLYVQCNGNGTNDDMLWNGSEEDGNARSECEEMKAMTVKMETVTLIGKGRYEAWADMNYNFFVVQKWKVETLFQGNSPTWCLLLCSFISCEEDE